MNESTSETSHPVAPATPAPIRAPAWQRWGLRLVVAMVIYTVVGFWLVPLIVRSVATSQLRKALDREVAIAKLRFNPYTFTTEIRGLAVQDHDGQLLAGWDRVRVNFQFTSLFYGPWRLKEFTVDQPRARIRINPDYTFNFSDLIEKFSAKEPPPPKEPAPLPRVWIDQLHIAGATVDFTDLTPATPFHRRLGPVDIALPGFSTLPGHTNTVGLQATTDAGENITWASQLWLDPPRLLGNFRLENLRFTPYAPLYQDFLQLQVKDGALQISTSHDLVFDPAHRVARLTDNRVDLTGLKIGLPQHSTNLLELDQLSVQAPLLDVWQRQATVHQVLLTGVRVAARRLADRKLEIVEVAQPPPSAGRPPGAALFVFEALTNVFAMFSGSTNAAVAVVEDTVLTNAAITLLDEVPPQPVQASITDLAVRVRNVSNQSDATPSATLTLRWQTNGIVDIKAAAVLTPPAANIELDLRDLDLSLVGPYLAEYADVSLLDSRLALAGKGWVEAPPGREPTGQFQGRIALENLHTAHALDTQDLLKWEGFRIDGIQVDLHPLNVAIDRIELAGPEVWAILNTNGTLNALTAARNHRRLVTPPGTAPEPAQTEPAPESVPTPETAAAATQAETPLVEPPPQALLPVHLASFVLTNATLQLLDQMAAPPVALTITNFNGELRRLSTTNLQHADFAFDGRVRSGGTFQIQGQLRPLDSADITLAQIKLEGLELTPGSPYTSRFLGYRLNAGKLSTDLTYQVSQGQLQATNRIVLDRLTLGAKVDSPDAIKAPIKLGLAVLQDRNGRIDLTVPVSGSLDDPQFSLGSVIRGAFANVFTKVLTSPFRMLGSMFGGNEDENLEEVEFQPGTAEPDPRSLDRLKKLEEILYERPALQLVIHGAADPQTDDTPDFRRARLAMQLQPTTLAEGTPEATDQPTPPAQPLNPEQYESAVRQAYETLIASQPPETTAEPVTTPATTETAAPAVEPATSPSTTEVRRPARRTLRGGEIMMRRRFQSTAPAQTAEPTPAPVETQPEMTIETLPPPPSLAVMEQRLLDDLKLGAEDWQALANARTDFVRQVLLAPARIELERIVVAEGEDPSPTTKVRLELQ